MSAAEFLTGKVVSLAEGMATDRAFQSSPTTRAIIKGALVVPNVVHPNPAALPLAVAGVVTEVRKAVNEGILAEYGISDDLPVVDGKPLLGPYDELSKPLLIDKLEGYYQGKFLAKDVLAYAAAGDEVGARSVARRIIESANPFVLRGAANCRRELRAPHGIVDAARVGWGFFGALIDTHLKADQASKAVRARLGVAARTHLGRTLSSGSRSVAAASYGLEELHAALEFLIGEVEVERTVLARVGDNLTDLSARVDDVLGDSVIDLTESIAAARTAVEDASGDLAVARSLTRGYVDTLGS